MTVIFSLTFSVGVFANPNFNIHEFCMNLSTEIVGMVIALVIVDRYVDYIKEKKESAKSNKNENETEK